jgi:hypothetical protein
MNPSALAIALILTAAATTAAAATSDADMMRCAAISERDARLDCFDALTHQLSSKAAAPAADQIPATQAPPAAVLAGDPKNFGLTAEQQHTVDVGPQMITANISNLGSNQKGETFVVLDNGQTWSVAGNDGWLATGQAVRIKRAAMGSYLMLIPSNHTYHVRRLK